MANRHLSRSIVLQTLFEWDFRGRQKQDVEDILTRDAEEFAPGVADISFMRSMTYGILERLPDLNLIIEKAAPEWPIDRISIVDRNVLRIGLYELLFADRREVPAKVAINEAIELAKSFGGENSGKFVNGVIGAVYKEIGEPGKEEVSKQKQVRQPVPYEAMPLERLGGAIVFARHEGEVHLAFVHDVFGHWTLSKGKLEAGENDEEGTIREIKEEIGLDIVIKQKVGENEYVANDPQIGKKRKRVAYFLAEAPYVELKLESSGGLDNAKWFKLAEVPNLNLYNDMVPLITKAIQMLLGQEISTNV
jgi:N utilization substance protein B